MATQIGFLDSLGVGTADEAALAQQARQEAFGKAFAQQYALGQQAAPLVGGLFQVGRGIIGGGKGRTFKGGIQNLAQGAAETADARDAAAVGLTVPQLKGRRKIRELDQELGTDGSFASRKELLTKVIKIANESGDTEIVGNALRQLQSLKQEEEEFLKLQATRGSAEAQLQDDITEDAVWNGKKVTGTQYRFEDGTYGLQFEADGQIRQERWGNNLYKVDGSEMTLAEAIRGSFTSSQRNDVEATITNAALMQRKLRRTMTMLVKSFKAGDIGLMLGTPQKATRVAEGALSDISSFVTGFQKNLDPRERDTESRTRKKLQQNFVDGSGTWFMYDGLKFETPDWIQKAGSNSRQFKANIMELAYMAARMREPSNRGLSDKDVEAALVSLVADARNPQDIMQRFAQMIGDADYEVQLKIQSVSGRINGFDDAEVMRGLVGAVYDEYLEAREGLRKDLGINVDSNGIGVFDHLIGLAGSATEQDDTTYLQPVGPLTYEDLTVAPTEPVTDDEKLSFSFGATTE